MTQPARRREDAALPANWTFARLREEAEEARVAAYAPYSGFAVGAALLTATGQVFRAANVENGSFSLTICAERAAVAQAVAHGSQDFAAIAVAGDEERVETLACCGSCLQVLAEFDRAHSLLVAFPDRGELRVVLLDELLPVRFRLKP